MLHVHRSERSDGLLPALADVLREPLADPFAVEVVAVPAKGVERWLTQRLAHALGTGPAGDDGVCANVRFPSPSVLVATVVDAADAADAVGAAGAVDSAAARALAPVDPWAPAALLWHVLDTLDAGSAEPWAAAVLGRADDVGGVGRRRRLATAQHLAALYDTYGAQRPQMLRAWAGGADTDGSDAALDPDLGWQPQLWRALRERIGTPSPAERLESVCKVVRARPELVELPERVSLFGPTRLATVDLEVLAALAVHREVHLWLPHPSPVLWDAVRRLGPTPGRRRQDPTVQLPRHPLLGSLGRDARELQMRLIGLDGEVRLAHHAAVPRPETVLGRLQQAIADDVPLPVEPAERRLIASGDRTVQVHACHGPARQVEVLREVLLGLLEGDPALEPRDVLVMCPDIEGYAPLISAAFGLAEDEGGEHPGHRLRVRLADRSLRQTNPLLATLSTLLDLADARVTASQVLDLAGSPPVRRRFRFDDDDLERMRQWVAGAGVRWGIDADRRGAFKLDGLAQNTWRFGLDRILTGVAMAGDDMHWLGSALPLDDVDSSDVALAGRLAELLDRLTTVLDALSGEQPLAGWLDALGGALDRLAAVSDADSWQLSQARRELADVAAAAGERAGRVLLALPDVRALLAGRLQGRPTRANFRTGSLTMCSMVPMRSVPHRVVCLLGLDDGVFPRAGTVDGDDVLARDPCVGERDRRSEDRQLLLDALLAAQDHLVVVYTGADERTGAVRPPAVPLGEILDVLDATALGPGGGPARDHVVVRHPLQPFDARNFADAALGRPGPFSFDRPSLDGARASLAQRAATRSLAETRLAVRAGDVALEDLIEVLEHPVRGFVRHRLGVSVLDDGDQVVDRLAVELHPLERWDVGERLVQARLAGADSVASAEAELRRGTLPPGALGAPKLRKVLEDVEPLVVAGEAVRTGSPRAVDVSVALGERLLSGTVGSVHGSTVVRVTYSRLSAKHRLRAWISLLALVASAPDEPWEAVTVGRASGSRPRRSTLSGVDPSAAAAHLEALVRLHDAALSRPVPMAAKTSAAYAERRHGGDSVDDALAAARKEWTADIGEVHDRYHRLVWGEGAPLEVLLVDPASAGDGGSRAGAAGWFGELACGLWTPLLRHEATVLA